MREWLLKCVEADCIREDVPLTSLTTFRIGGSADYVASPRTFEQLQSVLEQCAERQLPWQVMGKGSNILAADEGYRGLVILLDQMNEIVQEGTVLRAGAGVSLAALSQFAAKAELTGLEFAAGIPGTLGGAVYMNAGAYGGEMVQIVRRVTIMEQSGVTRTLAAEELGMGYRTSIFQNTGWIILRAELELQCGSGETIREQMRDLAQKRRSKQPLEWPSAGSAFKRPEGHFAGQLIEEAGLKGYTVGGAQVSAKHAGFIVNVGGATAADVLALVDHVQKTVELNSGGIHLQPEFRYLTPEALVELT